MERVGVLENARSIDRLQVLSGNWFVPVLVGHLALLAMGSMLLIGLPLVRYSLESLLFGIALSQVLMLGWILVSWNLVSGTLMNPFGLFTMATGAFHCSISLLIVAGRADAMFLVDQLSTLTMCRTLLAVTIALGMLYLGALAVSGNLDRPASRPDSDRSLLSAVGSILLLLSLPGVVASFVTMLTAVDLGGYIALFQGASEPGTMNTVLGLSENLFLVGGLLLVVGKSSVGRVIGFSVVIARSVLMLYLGYRAYALLPIVATIWLVHTANRPLPLKVLGFAGLSFLVVVAPLVRGIRDTIGLGRWSVSNLIATWQGLENPVTALLSDMGSSVLTVAFTLELVPSARPFEMGMGYVRAAMNSLPIIDVPSAYGYASGWLAWTIKPEWASNGFGFGYSFIAEAFLNFGWAGIAVVSLLIGLAIVKLTSWVQGDPLRAVFVAVFLPALLFFSRGESIDLVRPLLWQAGLPCLFIWFLRQVGKRQRKLTAID